MESVLGLILQWVIRNLSALKEDLQLPRFVVAGVTW